MSKINSGILKYIIPRFLCGAGYADKKPKTEKTDLQALTKVGNSEVVFKNCHNNGAYFSYSSDLFAGVSWKSTPSQDNQPSQSSRSSQSSEFSEFSEFSEASAASEASESYIFSWVYDIKNEKEEEGFDTLVRKDSRNGVRTELPAKHNEITHF